MKKNTLLTTIFIVSLLFSAVAGTHLVSLATANPYLYHKEISPPMDMKPPTISITPLKNNTVHSSKDISLTLTVSIPKYKSTYSKYYLWLTHIQYQTDWKDSIANCYEYPAGSGLQITDFSDNLTLKDIPEGSHNVTFSAYVDGGRADGLTWSYFGLQHHLTICFTVDTTAPTISVLSMENKTYNQLDLPLDFKVNEATSWAGYSLDNEANVTLSGNTTLTLKEGLHSITFYANDTAGNMAESETITFTVEEPPKPFPTTLVIASVIIIIGVFAVFLLVRKHKQNSGRTRKL